MKLLVQLKSFLVAFYLVESFMAVLTQLHKGFLSVGN